MKSVIVDIKNNFAAALADDGCVRKIKNKNYVIGQVIDMKKTTNMSFKSVSKIAVAACLFVLIALGGVGAYAYYTPTTYVSLDVNPSIEYELNTFDRVLSVNAVNDDGSEILDNIGLDSLINMPIEDAIQDTVNAIADEGYFDGETTGGIVITTSENDEEKAQQLVEQLEEQVKETVEEKQLDVEIEAMTASRERVQEAKALGVTPGKLNLVEKLKEAAENPDDVDFQEWLSKSVKEIQSETKQYKKQINNENNNINQNKEEQQNQEVEKEKNQIKEEEQNQEQINSQAQSEKPDNAGSSNGNSSGAGNSQQNTASSNGNSEAGANNDNGNKNNAEETSSVVSESTTQGNSNNSSNQQSSNQNGNKTNNGNGNS